MDEENSIILTDEKTKITDTRKRDWVQRSDEEIMEALKITKGKISKACELLNLNSSSSLQKRILRNPKLNQFWMDVKEITLDYVEDKLMELIDEKDFRAIQFFLTRQGKERGWGDETNINLNTTVAKYDFDKISLEDKKKALEAIRKAEVNNGDDGFGDGSSNSNSTRIIDL